MLFYRDPKALFLCVLILYSDLSYCLLKKKPKRTLKATTVTFYDSAGPCMFTVKAGEKSWVFRCECERDSEEWLVAFQLMEGFGKHFLSTTKARS